MDFSPRRPDSGLRRDDDKIEPPNWKRYPVAGRGEGVIRGARACGQILAGAMPQLPGAVSAPISGANSAADRGENEGKSARFRRKPE